MESLGTGFVLGEGQAAMARRSFTLMWEMGDPATGQKTRFRQGFYLGNAEQMRTEALVVGPESKKSRTWKLCTAERC